MSGLAAVWIVVGCALSVVCDWAFYERVATLLRQVEMPDRFTYAQGLLVRKIAVAAAGGLLAFSSVTHEGSLIAVAIGLWVILHLAIYVEWYRFARSPLKADTRKA